LNEHLIWQLKNVTLTPKLSEITCDKIGSSNIAGWKKLVNVKSKNINKC
jgi:hypothetical protein